MYLFNIILEYLPLVTPVMDFGVLIGVLQGILGAILPVMTLFRVVKRKSAMQVFACCLVPIVIIATNALAGSALAGSFLGGGFSAQKTERLQTSLDKPEVFLEIFLLCAVYVLCSVFFFLLDHLIGKTTVPKLLINAGIEYICVIAFCVIGINYFYGEGKIYHALETREIKWFVYGIFLLAGKILFYLTCLIFSLFFRERGHRYEFGKYAAPQKWIRGYLSKNHWILGFAALFFAVFLGILTIPALIEESKGQSLHPFTVLFLFVFVGLPGIIGFMQLFIAIFPALSGNYRRILKWGNTEQITNLLYRELEIQKPLLKFPLGNGFLTEHFLVIQMPFRIFYLPLYEKSEFAIDSTQKLYFKDGGRLRISEAIASDVKKQADAIKR